MLKSFVLIFVIFQILKNENVNCKTFDVITNHKLNQNQTAKLIRSYKSSYGVVKLSSCKAQLDNGDIIDLTTLDNINAPRSLKFEHNLIFILIN